MHVDTDDRWMQRALAEAGRGRGHVEPNPMVGAVLVRDDREVGVGYHARYGGPHAEVVALEAAGSRAGGATLYVTLEPCCHHGKTPPCTDAVLRSGVVRVVAAMTDPFPRVSGQGVARLRSAGLQVDVGIQQQAARNLNAPYLKRIATGRPYVIAKWAMTLDGKSATRSASSKWITGSRSRRLVHELRGRMDAILVGVDTVLADDPLLTARLPGPRVPRRVVLDSRARTPLGSAVVRTAFEVPTTIVVTDLASPDDVRAFEERGCEVIVVPGNGRVPIGPLLDILGGRGATNVLVEGGGKVVGSFLDAGEVDAVEVYLAPVIEGGDHAHTPVRGIGLLDMAQSLRLSSHQVEVCDGDVRILGRIARQVTSEPA